MKKSLFALPALRSYQALSLGLFLSGLITGLALESSAAQAATLGLNDFLSEVRTKNTGVQGALESATSAEDRASESGLVFAPQLFGNAQLASDAKLAQVPVITYDKIITNSYTLGVSEQFRFGLQAKVSYNILYTRYVNPALGGGSTFNLDPYHDTRPAIEFSQPLWGGGFGRAARASAEAQEAQILARGYTFRQQARSSLVSAETTYWRLALARQAVAVGRETLDRATRLHEWSSRRARLHLADESDALQAEAALQLRRLELRAALDEERSAARAFNSARGQDSDTVGERLIELTPSVLTNYPVPARSDLRDDVKAARELSRATVAQATAAVERDTATFDVFGAYALNGRKNEVADSLADPFAANRPTQAIGVRFTYPLTGAASDAKRGWAHEEASADALYQRQVFEQEDAWKDLNSRLGEAKRRYELAQSIEKAQEVKLTHERTRLNSGRSTTYQVLLFQQDYSQAQLSRIRASAEILNILTQMKLFGDQS